MLAWDRCDLEPPEFSRWHADLTAQAVAVLLGCKDEASGVEEPCLFLCAIPRSRAASRDVFLKGHASDAHAGLLCWRRRKQGAAAAGVGSRRSRWKRRTMATSMMRT